MQEVTIVLPVCDNTGKSLDKEIARILKLVLTVAGGYSTSKQTGAWLDNGKVYHDEAIRMVTVVETDKVCRLRTIAVMAKLIMRQEAVFFQVRTVDVEFI